MYVKLNVHLDWKSAEKTQFKHVNNFFGNKHSNTPGFL